MKIKTELRYLFAFFVVALTACSNPLGSEESRVDAGYGTSPQIPVKPSQTGVEPVSASLLNATSLAGTHQVDVTVGSSTSEIKLTTSQNKVIYLSVQGQLISR